MLVKDIMATNPKVIDASATVLEAARIMADENFGFLPVQDNDKIIGMLTDRDILLKVTAKNKEASKTKAQDVMTKDVFYCYETDTLEKVLDMFGNKQINRMPVMNENKRLVGAISLGDISRAAKNDTTLNTQIGKTKVLISKVG